MNSYQNKDRIFCSIARIFDLRVFCSIARQSKLASSTTFGPHLCNTLLPIKIPVANFPTATKVPHEGDLFCSMVHTCLGPDQINYLDH